MPVSRKTINPYWSSPDRRITIYCADCVDVLPLIPSNSVDGVITDPPFGIGFRYNTHDDTPEGYGKWLWSIIESAESKCRAGSPMFVWQAMPNIKRLPEWFPRDWRLFAAAKNFVQMRPCSMQYAFDPVVVWWTGGDKPYSLGASSRDFHIANTANTSNRGIEDANGHPCARPLGQVQHIIEQWVRPGGTVLEPFLGSGTVAVACNITGRKCIGVEKDQTYCDHAIGRIKLAMKEPQTAPRARRITR